MLSNSPRLGVFAVLCFCALVLSSVAAGHPDDTKKQPPQTSAAGTVPSAQRVVGGGKNAGANSGAGKKVQVCAGGTYGVRLRALTQAGDASGLAQAVNGTFDEFSAFAVAASADGSSDDQDQTGHSSSGKSKSKTKSSSPNEFLCVYLRDLDPKTGELQPLVLKGLAPAIQHDETALESVIRQLDRPEFAGVNLDERFVVYLAHIPDASLVASALPAPVPGIDFVATQPCDKSDSPCRHYLVLGPASDDLQLTTKAGADLASQAAKIKRDLLALDRLVLLQDTDAVSGTELGTFLNAITNATDDEVRSKAVLKAQIAVEKWDADHTVYLAALDPRDIAVHLADDLFPGRDLQVLERQRAITFRPKLLPPSSLSAAQQGVLAASDAVEREVIHQRYKTEQSWEQNLKSDPTSSAKQGGGNSNSGQPPVTTTTSNTTIATPAPTKAPAAKTAAPIQVQTTTSTQTTSGSNAQGGSAVGAAQDPDTNATPSGSGSSAENTDSGAKGGAAGKGGSSGKQGGASGSANVSQAGQISHPDQALATGTVVRLFHLRQASNIATVLNAMVPETNNSQLVKPLEDFGNDDLLLILPPASGHADNSESIRRTIAFLDEPRPAVSLQVWSYEISSEERKKPDDRRGLIDQANQVADAYGRFTRAVISVDNQIQSAMAAGLANAIQSSRAADFSFDPVFWHYLTDTSQDCLKLDRYCLGYDTALKFGAKNVSSDKSFISLNRFVVLIAAASDSKAGPMIENAMNAMQTAACPKDPSSEPPLPCGATEAQKEKCKRERPVLLFSNLRGALQLLTQIPNLHMFRAALLDFLFQYKWSQAYPNDFDPYYLQRSAQNLDGYLNTLITALDRDLDLYLHERLHDEAKCITDSFGRQLGMANYGEVQVNAISGDPANVSGMVNNYFDITQPALLKDVLSGLLSGSGGSSSSGSSGGSDAGSGQGSGSGGDSGGHSGKGSASESGKGGSTPSSGSGSSGAASTLASAAKLLTPWQAVALNALATASAPPQLMAQVNAQTTLAVTPISLDTASAAELKLSLQISNPTTTVDASTGSKSSFIRKDMANSVANYSVQTQVRVDSLKLFQVSSLSMDLTHLRSSVPIPVIGWAWESIFGGVPGMKEMFAIPRPPETIENRSIAVVRAVVVPTAMDLGLSMPFHDDHIEDPLTGTSKTLSSAAQTSNKFPTFHKKLMKCILSGEDGCMESTRLSQIPEQVFDLP